MDVWHLIGNYDGARGVTENLVSSIQGLGSVLQEDAIRSLCNAQGELPDDVEERFVP